MYSQIFSQLCEILVFQRSGEFNQLAFKAGQNSLRCVQQAAEAKRLARAELDFQRSTRSIDALLQALADLESYRTLKCATEASAFLSDVISAFRYVLTWKIPVFADPQTASSARKLVDSIARAFDGRKLQAQTLIEFLDYYEQLLDAWAHRDLQMPEVDVSQRSPLKYRGVAYFDEISVVTEMMESARKAAHYARGLSKINCSIEEVDESGKHVTTARSALIQLDNRLAHQSESAIRQIIFGFHQTHKEAKIFWRHERESKLLPDKQKEVSEAKLVLLEALRSACTSAKKAYEVMLSATEPMRHLATQAAAHLDQTLSPSLAHVRTHASHGEHDSSIERE